MTPGPAASRPPLPSSLPPTTSNKNFLLFLALLSLMPLQSETDPSLLGPSKLHLDMPPLSPAALKTPATATAAEVTDPFARQPANLSSQSQADVSL